MQSGSDVVQANSVTKEKDSTVRLAVRDAGCVSSRIMLRVLFAARLSHWRAREMKAPPQMLRRFNSTCRASLPVPDRTAQRTYRLRWS